MRCIFCLQEAAGTVEHVFPQAIGGPLTTNRVCVNCNSKLGSGVDAALCNSFIVRHRRAQFGLAGNSGSVPGLYELLEGVSNLAAQPGKRLHSEYNPDTNKLDLRLLTHRDPVDLGDGSKTERITMDYKDIGNLPEVLQRYQKKHGLPPLTQEQIDAKLKEAEASVQVIENPEVTFNVAMDFSFVKQAMLKIIYELAFLWLGEAYLDDPLAEQLREAILKNDPESDNCLQAWFGTPGEDGVLTKWDFKPNEHAAIGNVLNGMVVITIRVFDAHAAWVPVSANAAQYLQEPGGDAKIRFLTIDSISRRHYDVPLMEESVRAFHAVRALGGNPRTQQFPSPLSTQ